MVLNLERLGLQLGCEQVDYSLLLAFQDPQKYFLTIHARMQPLRECGEGLAAIANYLQTYVQHFEASKTANLACALACLHRLSFHPR